MTSTPKLYGRSLASVCGRPGAASCAHALFEIWFPRKGRFMNRYGQSRCALLAFLLGASSCYSSESPPFRVMPYDAGPSPPLQMGMQDVCVPRKPWEEAGVTGMIFVGTDEGLLISKDRYYELRFDPATGNPSSWGKSGLLRDREGWNAAPSFDGQKPWEGFGVTAAYRDKREAGKGEKQVVINRFRMWTYQDGSWTVRSLVDAWGLPDAGPTSPQPMEGEQPWEGTGVTAIYLTPDESALVVINKVKVWVRRNGIWDLPSKLSNDANWQSAPTIAGKHAYDPPGVTATWQIKSSVFHASVDKLWIYQILPPPTPGRWTATLFKDAPGWDAAPANSCTP